MLALVKELGLVTNFRNYQASVIGWGWSFQTQHRTIGFRNLKRQEQTTQRRNIQYNSKKQTSKEVVFLC
jgi:hypothetical protein